jgi:hypothetical protein
MGANLAGNKFPDYINTKKHHRFEQTSPLLRTVRFLHRGAKRKKEPAQSVSFLMQQNSL